MYNVEVVSFDDLTEDEQENAPNNGAGKEYATYIKIVDVQGTRVYSDAMEPEDASFSRNLDWIVDELQAAYENGKSNH